MNRLSSYSFLKNLTFALLIVSVLLTVGVSLYFSGKIYSFSVDTMRSEYNSVIALQGIENSVNRAFEIYNANVSKEIIRPDDVLLPIRAMQKKCEYLLSKTKSADAAKNLKQAIYRLKIIRAGFNSIEDVRYTPSQSDYYSSTVKVVNENKQELVHNLTLAGKTLEDEYIEILGVVLNDHMILGDVLERYVTDEQLDNETVKFLLRSILKRANDVKIEGQYKAMYDVVISNISMLTSGSEDVLLYRLYDPNMGHLEEEISKVQSLWNDVLSNLVYIRNSEMEQLKLAEAEVEASWAKKKRLFLIFAGLVSLFAISTSLLLNKLMYTRINNILTGINKFSSGNYEARITVQHNDYISEISKSFNQMAENIFKKEQEIKAAMDSLLEHKEELQKAHDSMEAEVENRTRKLREVATKLSDEVIQKKEKEKELLLFKKISEFSNESIFVSDAKMHFIYVNDACVRMNGYTLEELQGADPTIFVPDGELDIGTEEIERRVRENNCWTGELLIKKKNGDTYPAYVSIFTILDKNGDIEYIVTSQRDISDIKMAHDELLKMAFYDSLTGLPNRALCVDRLNLAINNAKRHKNKVAVFFLDLDKFKNINDTLGHDAGDALLEMVAGRLLECGRETDTVCRLGGDEFVMILTEIDDINSLHIVASRVIEKICEPFEVIGNIINTSTSIGITVYPDDGHSYDKLMKNADMAMYKAKTTQRGTFEFYSNEYDKLLNERLNAENKLIKAIEEREFVPFFQPIMDSQTGKVVGVEVLARWLDDGNIRYPNEFIDILEESGDIFLMTKIMIEDAMIFLKKLDIFGITDIWLSVNISPVTLIDAGKIKSMVALVKKFDVDPSKVTFEITENVLIHDFDTVKPVLDVIRNSGIKIALDDFGSGYSSLNYLNSLMPDKLKLDKSFVDQIVTGDGIHICKSVAKLAENMGIELIAEGVEDIQQLEQLSSMGYRYIQGYYYSKPEWEEQVIDVILDKNLA